MQTGFNRAARSPDAPRRQAREEEPRPLLVAAAESETERRVLFRRALLKQKLQARIVNDLVVLLEYIAHCGGETAQGCKAYVKTYANKLQLPERTAANRLKVLRELAFIQSQARKDKSSLVWIDLEAIREFANRPEDVCGELEASQFTQDNQAGDCNSGSHVTASPAAGDCNFGGHVSARLASGDCKSCRHIVSSISSLRLVPPPVSSAEEENFGQGFDQGSGNSKGSAPEQAAAEGSAGKPPFRAASSYQKIWDQLARQLTELGMFEAQPAIALAQQHGLTQEHVQGLIAHFQKHPGAWGLGYLHRRLKQDLPGTDPLEGWPAPSEQYQQQARARQQQVKLNQAVERQRDHAARRQQLQRELEQIQQRLARWQSRLKTLTRSQVREILLEQHPPERAEFLAGLGPQNQDVQLAVCEIWEATSEVPV